MSVRERGRDSFMSVREVGRQLHERERERYGETAS